jgi:glycosyltransferase involved in cell wall biosynthesis
VGTIKTTIESVLSQNFVDYEYIIVDGGSIDGTLDLIKTYESKFNNNLKFISEPDNGIYDAMNKGINIATGEIIGFLNSDDLYIDNNVLSIINDKFNQHNTDSLIADLYYVKRENIDTIIRKWSTGKFKKGSFRKGWHPAHPTFFVKNKIYKKYGGFNLSLKLAADFELMLRFLEKEQVSNFYFDKCIIKMRLGGETSKNFKNIFAQNKECIIAFKLNSLSVPLLYPFFRILPKFIQYLKK